MLNMNAQRMIAKAGKTPFFDYKSAALPTELYRRLLCRTGNFGPAKTAILYRFSIPRRFSRPEARFSGWLTSFCDFRTRCAGWQRQCPNLLGHGATDALGETVRSEREQDRSLAALRPARASIRKGERLEIGGIDLLGCSRGVRSSMQGSRA